MNLSKLNSLKIDKSYSLINAKYKLNPIEIKLVLSIVGLVRSDDEELKDYIIPLKHFEFLTKNENYTRLRQACKSLFSKPLEIETDRGWKMFTWFSYIEYDRVDSVLRCRLDKEMKPYLIQLKENFKSYSLKYILQMDSQYSIRLYELLKQYEKIGERKFALEELYETLQVSKSSRAIGQFKRSILHFAQEELEKYSDIHFEYEEIKPSRKITGIKFIIFPNNPEISEKENEHIKFLKWIEYIRKNHINEILIYYPPKKANLRVSEKGMLYLDNGTNLNGKSAKTWWKWLYEHKEMLEIGLD